jgi:CHAT domain-containing protein
MRYFILTLMFYLMAVAATWAQDCIGSSDALLGDSYFDTAKEQHKSNNIDSAILHYQNAKKLYLGLGCYAKAARASTNLTLVYSQVKDSEHYKVELYEVLQLAEQKLSATDTIAAKIYQIAGTDYHKNYKIDSALLYLNKSKEIYKANKSWQSYVRLCRTTANVAQVASNFKLMKANIDDAYAVMVGELGSPPDLDATLQQLYGALYYRTGEYERALEAMQRGLLLSKKNLRSREDTLTIINYYNNIGLLYIEVGDILKSEDYCLNAKSLSIQIGDYYRAAMIYYNLAESFSLRGDDLRAFTGYRKGLQMLDSLAQKGVNILQVNADIDRVYINLHNGVAEVAARLGKNDQALEALNKNIAIHKKEKYREEETFRILGQYYIKTANLAQARLALNNSLNINLRLYGGTHPLVARSYLLLGRVAAAEQKYPLALSYFEKSQQALLSNPQINDINKLPSSENISDKETYLYSLYERGLVLVEMKNYKDALRITQHAVQLIDQLRNSIKTEGSKLFIQKKVMPIYELNLKINYHFYAQQSFGSTSNKQYLEDAFRLMEKSKGLLLLDALKSEEARNFGNLPKEMLLEDRRLSREISRVEKALFEAQTGKKEALISKYQADLLALREESLKFQQSLETKYPRYFELKYKEKVASTKRLQSALAPNAQFIEYFVGTEHIYVFVATKQKTKLYQIIKTAELDNQIVALRTALTNSQLIIENPKAAYYLFVKNAHAVYEAFLGDFLDSTKKQLIIIPDGLLNYIPFETLLYAAPSLNDENIHYNFKILPYLLLKYTIHYNYSASLMLFGTKGADLDNNGKVLAFAPTYSYKLPPNPTPDELRQASIRTKVKELPGAKFELNMLSQFFKGVFVSDSAATESRLKAEMQKARFSIIHLAMHGWVDNDRPEYSCLILTADRDTIEDNMLHAYEIPLLDINSDMVVLSACETGFGRYERGEGVVSLGRGFMLAGANSIAMTLWSINDQATAILMTHFYDKLSEHMPKDRALQEAKIAYINSADSITAHPFFWAGFVLIGDESAIKLRRQLSTGEYILYGAGIAGVIGAAILVFALRRKRKRPHQQANNTTV